MSNKILGAALVVVAIIAIGGYVYPKVDLTKIDLSSITQKFGARGGDSNDLQCITQNGLLTCSTHKPLVNATTTPCAIKSPSATSTLVFDSTQITTASSTATTWTFAKATTPFATTTLLNTFSLSSGVFGMMTGTSSPSATTGAGVDDPRVFAPNTYLVVGVAGMSGSFDSAKLNGFCSAQFTQ